MALRAIDVATLDAPTRVARPLASVTSLQAPRAVALGAARRERRRWMALGGLLVGVPFVACLGVLEVVR
jgi:hypothetical protein